MNDSRLEQNFIVIKGQTPIPADGEDSFNTLEEARPRSRSG